jgi:membrane protein required for colicin V production
MAAGVFVPADFVFMLIIAAALIRCVYLGFVAELMTLGSVIAGTAAGFFFSSELSGLLNDNFGFSSWNQLLAFLILFLLVYLLFKLVQAVLYKIIDSVNLYSLDRALGFFLGLLEGFLLVMLIIFIIRIQPFMENPSFLDGSFFYEIFLNFLGNAGELQLYLQV